MNLAFMKLDLSVIYNNQIQVLHKPFKGVGVQNLVKHAYVVLEQSFTACIITCIDTSVRDLHYLW